MSQNNINLINLFRMNKTKTLSKLALVRAVISPSDILTKKSQKFILGGYDDGYSDGMICKVHIGGDQADIELECSINNANACTEMINQ